MTKPARYTPVRGMYVCISGGDYVKYDAYQVLQQQLEALTVKYKGLVAEYAKQTAEVEWLLEAVEWYANECNYDQDGIGPSPIELDGGRKAKTALTGGKEGR